MRNDGAVSAHRPGEERRHRLVGEPGRLAILRLLAGPAAIRLAVARLPRPGLILAPVTLRIAA